MLANRRLLVVGSLAVRDAVLRALPGSDVVLAEHPLDALWRSGHESFDGVVMSMAVGGRALAAIRGLRKIAPQTRIVISCDPADEPIARRGVDEGADDYLLEPLDSRDIQRQFKGSAPPRLSASPATPGPSALELIELAEVLRGVCDGGRATLERLAGLIRRAFGAAGAFVEIDDLSGGDGDVEQPVLEESIRRQERAVGRVVLSRCEHGAYSAAAASRLADYAKLADTVFLQCRQQQHWQELAWTDDLSGLRNRRYFERQLDELLRRAAADRFRVTVLLFDIDDFKSYNDKYGHDVGDELIREVSRLLTQTTRERDIVARLGGDEFAVIFWDAEKRRVPGSEHPREIVSLAKRFCRAIASHEFACLGDAAPGPVTISGGLACFPWNGAAREPLLKAADDALLAAKRVGKNRIQLAGKAVSAADAVE